MTQQLNELNAAVTQVVRQTPGTPFNLGEINVNVTAAASEASPVTVGIDQNQIANLNLTNAAKALDYLPGVSIQHLANNRNEAGIMVRGFSTRGQVPLYVDGIPISVPYDGYVDFNRVLSSDIAEVQVARGYSSPLLGPNALGGSINMVTEEPLKKLDADALIGTGSGKTLLSSLRPRFALATISFPRLDRLAANGLHSALRQFPRLPVQRRAGYCDDQAPE